MLKLAKTVLCDRRHPQLLLAGLGVPAQVRDGCKLHATAFKALTGSCAVLNMRTAVQLQHTAIADFILPLIGRSLARQLNRLNLLNLITLASMSGKQRNLRKKRALDEDGDGPDAEPEVQKETLEDLKLLQRMRKRTGGMDAAALAVKGTTEAGFSGTDEENKLMEAYVKAQGGQNVLDDEAHMQKYVEREMARRRGVELDEGEKKMSKAELEEMELYKVPEGLQVRAAALWRLAAAAAAHGVRCGRHGMPARRPRLALPC